MEITQPDPQWVMETMPMPRVMGDMVTLPNGQVLIVNGAGSGAAGWDQARDPVLSPVLYRPHGEMGSRFQTLNPSKTPRMYHSTATLVRDGRVLVGGSNPNEHYNFTGIAFPTELSLEAFSPEYLDATFDDLRPTIIAPTPNSIPGVVGYKEKVTIQVRISGTLVETMLMVNLIFPAFTTHSFSMNQRLLQLGYEKVTSLGNLTYNIEVMTPSSTNLAPRGFYLLFVVHQDIPSEGIWLKLEE
ncbi:Galactose oxidase/kelch, beta-propeller [Corchorus olitorius]|uniref:Galactose oxidase/kelch, beta-propeller n=1 Tax=Corchorus olitorius TaxID=93759 RepID=A0A1R3HY73_9ROSI|nr:Galactose oxidase/kelch, beta-propeller [Corchorus olitorius]